MAKSDQILIVDDEPSARDTMEAFLLREGYDLAFASDGPEGLARAAELTPDLILLDVMMPGMDGFEVCQRLRTDPLLAEVPVIMVTALEDHDSRLRGIEAGADDFVSKPFDRAELRARVRTTTRLNRYRRLMIERARFEWVVEKADDGYLIVDDGDQVLYANPRSRLYLDLLAGESEPVAGTFLELARRQYRCEPQEAWTTWPQPPAGASQSQRYLVRPESATANAFWLQVDLMEMASTSRLVHLRDVTASAAAQRDMWTFHAQVNHKLRTSLGVLIGFLNYVDDPSVSEEMRKNALSSMRIGAARLQSEIQCVLRYLQVMATPGHSRCSLAEIPPVIDKIGASLKLKSTSVSHKGVESCEDTFVPLSPQAIELILWELMENAVKFHPAGSPTLEIVISGVAEGICIQVCDNGLTLAPDQLAKMWIPYYQAERHFTGQVPGMGLGLPVVASQVWSVGGTCGAYNRTDGPGVVVELVLPRAKDEEQANE